nr:MAG TPA: hypothetical protein [Caudoviricetes sp.]
MSTPYHYSLPLTPLPPIYIALSLYVVPHSIALLLYHYPYLV